MSDDRTVKKKILENTNGRRKAERPNLLWLGSIESGLKSVGVNRCRKKAEDRSMMAIILKQALVTV